MLKSACYSFAARDTFLIIICNNAVDGHDLTNVTSEFLSMGQYKKKMLWNYKNVLSFKGESITNTLSNIPSHLRRSVTLIHNFATCSGICIVKFLSLPSELSFGCIALMLRVIVYIASIQGGAMRLPLGPQGGVLPFPQGARGFPASSPLDMENMANWRETFINKYQDNHREVGPVTLACTYLF